MAAICPVVKGKTYYGIKTELPKGGLTPKVRKQVETIKACPGFVSHELAVPGGWGYVFKTEGEARAALDVIKRETDIYAKPRIFSATTADGVRFAFAE